MLTGELAPSSGTVSIPSNATIAYASQDPWIMYGPVRENILFGKEFDADLYQSVVKACVLDQDFGQMRDGEETVIDGSQLSGGQKARIALARVLYRDSDILLLDDPLSAGEQS